MFTIVIRKKNHAIYAQGVTAQSINLLQIVRYEKKHHEKVLSSKKKMESITESDSQQFENFTKRVMSVRETEGACDLI